MLPVKITPPEAIAAARQTLAAEFVDWSNVEVTLRPRNWVVTFREVKTTAARIGWTDAQFPRGENSRYRDATVYVDADTGAVVRKELTP